MESQQFGQRRPPLSVTIKAILERYPDGQIFKEMIQNADDAGAKTVWFYVDERQHGTSNLPHPDLARFQGPALVAANDACFTKEDWEGIQSLQQSIKAEDPFKVGRFGIGFNSVYHLTDLPIIVSGDRIACFEPQEVTWKGESGQQFDLPSLINKSSDFVSPLNRLAGFDPNTVRQSRYSQTIFRLPLRTVASGLSGNIYNTQKLFELIDALREEAKYLLLFLKSVCKIEVVQISPNGQQTTSFCVEIAPANLPTVTTKRDSFMQQLRQAHARQPYQITNVISFTAKFSVVVTDTNSRNNQAGTTDWLIANSVGSPGLTVQAAALKQHTFPWVGAVLELGGSSARGRIFCFLPMPVEASSGLPIHVNGTFGLNDERRSLKWPGIERRNDPMANWNKTLVSQLLPPCYVLLLTEAKSHLSPEQFYNAWPDVQVVKRTQFSEILHPLLTSLFKQAVVWTEVGNWILTSQATFISEGTSLHSVVQKVLSSCGVQLVTVPTIVWRAIKFASLSVTEVSPKLTRLKLCSNPGSYSSIDQYGKRVILTYCLSDNCYSDLSGLNLLPLANGTCTSFDNHYGAVYLCTADCPRSLLPNLDHLLVDLSDDPSLQRTLYQVASSQQTRLRVLTDREVASLLSQAMPSNWRSSNLVSMPHSQLPSAWLQTFWTWLKNKNLNLFSNQLLVPCYSSTSHSTQSFYLARLSTAQPVVYVSSYSSCSKRLLSALYKLNVRVCLQSEFSFVQHRQLSGYIKTLDTNNVLDTIYSQSNYTGVAFTTEEADSLRVFLISGSYTPTSSRKAVLQSLAIFSSATNSQGQLYSVSSAASQSVSRQALGEPTNCAISVSNLPPNLILFSRGDYHQLQLLQALQISFPTDYQLLVSYVFLLINNGAFPDHLIDSLMTEVLDRIQTLNSRGNLSSSLQTLRFVKISYGRRNPAELFNPLNADIAALYSGEDVFPLAPYNTPQRIYVLLSCGLRNTVSPQQVLDIVYSISSSTSSHPQSVNGTKLKRATAVLEYISTPAFYGQVGGYYTIANNRYQSFYFSDALKQLATSYSWLPVLSDRPLDYCSELPWKGSGYSSQFISLGSSVVVLSPSTAHTLPHLVGSQVYLVSPSVSPQIAAMLPTDPATIAQHVVSHFRVILSHKDQLSVEDMDSLIHRVYQYMNSEGASALGQLYSIRDWIYIKRKDKFIAPGVVALKQNSSFRRDLEPYVYILPDSLSQYTALFGSASGVSQAVSQDQILSILTSIKEEVDAGTQRTTAGEAWDVVMSILNWLTNNGNKTVDQSIDPYVPIETESEWPQLVPASEVVYTDNDFMKTYLQSSEERDNYTFIHQTINPQLARALGVVPLTEFLDISEDTFEDAGQHEPLTTRLRNILKDYKDGLTIIKELLQNADDAEATEVNICYDARQHETNPKRLFFSGMADAHGPALIVHNNKTFSDDDFKNITKLAAATKQGKVLKIGKFGIGFCSVYHMTDVPSFISRDKLYIFDPTLSYLKKEIKNPSQPGKKIVFTKKIISGSDQLSPYDKLFGFNRCEFKGTMFRFPFRTHASELSGTCYTETTVRELVSAIRESSTNVLLFLQHVRTITFQRIDPGQSTPQVVLKVTRETVNPSLPISMSTGAEIRKLSCTSSSDGEDSTSCHWLVSQETESHSQNQYYTASVACPLGSSSYTVSADFEGEIFCFLPLSQKTGLPVHVSSNFAVINNRRGIWTSDEATSQTDREVTWNVTLMNGVIPKAYHNLLVALKQLVLSGSLNDYIFHSLWPLMENLQNHNPWSYMVTALYKLLVQSSLFYSDYSKNWLRLNDSKFLEAGVLSLDGSQSLDCVLTVLQRLGFPIVDLPVKHRQMLVSYVLNIVNESTFIELFFGNFSNLEDIADERNLVIRQMLELYATLLDNNTPRKYTLESYLQSYECIPCTPDGQVFRACGKVVDPSAKFAQLFDKSEGYFPIGELMERHLARDALLKMGMISLTLPWGMLIERAQTVPKLYQEDTEKALTRVNLIINTDTPTERESSDVEETLDSIPFLPVVQSPQQDYPLSWKGKDTPLLCGNVLVRAIGTRNSVLSGTQVAFVCESQLSEGGCGRVPQRMLRVLNVREEPTIDNVINHFKELIRYLTAQQELPPELTNWTTSSCEHIYEFLNNKLRSAQAPVYVLQNQHEMIPLKEQIDLSPLVDLPCIWTGKVFVKPEVVIRKWSMSGPYMYSLPSSLSNLTLLTKALGIKEDLTFKDIQHALLQMKVDFRDKPVSEECKTLLTSIVSPLLKLVDMDSDSPAVDIALPREDFVMHSSTDLAYNDAPWAPKDDQWLYVNSMIPRELAKSLGVNPVRSRMLESYANLEAEFGGVPFGQHEKLTQRIQNILHDYPFDITVLKELLQNADDAQATKMFIVLDKRTHGKESILSENWADLQGPALLVWNDREFTEADLQGIQKLGLGSKRSSLDTIGQYGLGFNVVYHLTDCPSFITATGGGTLCVLDPHCRYVHGATPGRPGMRYDKSFKSFWEKFKDMKRSFLLEGLKDAPDFSKGSLFRFPLRSTKTLVEKSDILDHNIDEPDSLVISAGKMSGKLYAWAPEMKRALLFLNHICELQFFIIEENGEELIPTKHYQSSVEDSCQDLRDTLHTSIKNFTQESGSTPSVIKYPLTIKDISPHAHRPDIKKERWLIQQGVGDIENRRQNWNFVQVVKPRHGIAAPLELSQPQTAVARYRSRRTDHSVPEKFIGQVFCFLPLPVKSELPVHINGNFLLDSSRRNLWQADEADVKTEWNHALLDAIASSYADFLENSKTDYVPCDTHPAYHDAQKEVKHYYKIFSASHSLKEPFLQLSKCVYKTLIENNARVLAVITTTNPASGGEGDNYCIQWHPIRGLEESAQVYFWKGLNMELTVILENIGMKLTRAPSGIQSCLNAEIQDEAQQIKSTTPETVFSYYSRHGHQVSDTGQFPCLLENSAFKTVETLKTFLKYVLCKNEENPKILEFPSHPFGSPVLLTADGSLRVLTQVDKVIRSEFYHLFPNSLAKFLHPELLQMSFSKELFICVGNECDDEEELAIAQRPEHMPEYTLVKHVLTAEIPRELQGTEVCSEYESLISKEKLKEFWKCLVNDDTFKFFLQTLVKQLALLPCTNGCLYSTSTPIIPAYPDGSTPLPMRISQFSVSPTDLTTGFNTLKQLGVPFLDTTLLCGASIDSCPTLRDVDVMLKHLCCLHEQEDLSDQLSKDVALALIQYFKAISFERDPNSCSHIKSLPLFENTDGTFTALNGKTAYVWPSQVCNKGYQKWLKRYNAVFLKPYTDWTKLGSPEQLKIGKLSAAQVYIDYILPAFALLNEEERYEHLRHIKDKLINEYTRLRDDPSPYNASNDYFVRRQQACTFLSALVSLPCIGGDGEQLRPVRDFCNHKKQVFQIFKTHFRFLPEYFMKSHIERFWLLFFETIGLKVSLTQAEYLDFCREVSRGQHKEPRKASETLIEYLFSSDFINKLKWDQSQSFFATLSDIPFVCTEDVLIDKQYEWICPAAKPCNRVKDGGQRIGMTRFREAALSHQAVLLWTVKPVVTLPGYSSLNEEHRELLTQLQVTHTAEVVHVVENIKNICKNTKLANQKLFDKYPESLKKPEEGDELICVMSRQFKFLSSKDIVSPDAVKPYYATLTALPCIPVHSTKEATPKWQVVLVKPCNVVSYGDVESFHPFIHELPSKLLANGSGFLKNIGIQSKLGLSHMQIVLEATYNASGGDELDENTSRCVVEAVTLIHKLLKATTEPPAPPNGDVEKVLSRLYLPTVDGTLALSTDMVYADKSNYRTTMPLDLEETPYKELSIEQALYEFSDTSFCALLPNTLRPIGLSTICRVQVASGCKTVGDNELAKRLKKSLALDTVRKGCLTIVEGVTGRREIYQALKTPIINFLSNIEVKTVNRLEASVILIHTESEIGKAAMPCFLHSKPTGGDCLYIDLDLDITDDEPYKLILDNVMHIVRKQNIPDNNLREIEELLRQVLKAQSSAKVRSILDTRGFDSEGGDMEEVEFQIGFEIPQCWMHRLDQSPDSVFHSGERVGYQKAPETVVFAEILDPVLPEGSEDFENIPRVEMQYRIFVSPEDETGIVVSTLNLYKFLCSSLEDDLEADSSDSTALQPYGVDSKRKLRKEDIEDIKKELMEQLDRMWRLPDNEKQKAIKRLYLKWHPDKNPENEDVAEEIFKFLVTEISRRGSSKQPQWDSEARTHNFYHRHESKQRQQPRSTHFDGRDFQIRKNKEEGKRWLRQAVVDAKALEVMFSGLPQEPQLACTLCFQAHQVVEKALKAGKFYVCGLTENALKITQLTTHACGLQHKLRGQASGLAALVSPLDEYYQKTRYPNHCDPPSIPADEFTADQATKAVQNARKVLDIIKKIVQ